MNDNNIDWTELSWDPWPCLRLLAVFAATGLWAHWRFAWTLPALPAIVREVLSLFEIFFICAVLSRALAQFYLILLVMPLYGVVFLNSWFYDGSHWVLRRLSGLRSPRLQAGLALAGELGLFVGLWYLLEILLRSRGH